MRKAAERFSAPLLVLLVTASLVFGASVAFAQSRGSAACVKNPPSDMGFCVTYEGCALKCEGYGVPECTQDGCCRCN